MEAKMMTYDEYMLEKFRGKSIDRIEKAIALFREKIRGLRKERNRLNSSSAHFKGNLNKVECKIYKYDRKLDCAIKAFIEAGGEYIPTRYEEEAFLFNQKLESITKIVYYFETFNEEWTLKTIDVSESEISMDVMGDGFGIGDGCSCVLSTNKEEFIQRLKGIHMNEWLHRYHARYVLDGSSWSLILCFSNGEVIDYHGANDFPHNFDDLRNLFYVLREVRIDGMQFCYRV